MKFLLFLSLAALVTILNLNACTSAPAAPQATAATAAETEASKSRKELIKEEKRRQSEADLPFRVLDTSARIDKIAFGSGADQNQPQPIWQNALDQNPDLFILTGDSIYAADSINKPIGDQYKKLNKIAEYRAIREKVPFMAIWNDQDYGQIDGGSDNPEKDFARTEFVKYWGYLRSTLPPTQKALYHAKIFGTKKQTVQVIMLDTRWDRSSLKRNVDDTFNAEKPEADAFPRPYLIDEDKTKHILSEAQWSWLETELRKPAAFKILVSPIQVIANDHQFEKWGLFPHERDRLLNLIRKAKAKHIVILSGDRHLSAIAKTYIQGFNTIYDVTANALNNPVPRANALKDSSYNDAAFGGMTFGLININWDKKKAQVEFHSLDGQSKQSVEVPF
ncbi:MAG: alkaline phosphatase family protein [Bdellovibrionaceae bacterium]|nr:alkaline phosphatase family protein [Bdellovibrio sp.]